MAFSGLSNFERIFDRIAPVAILALGVLLTAAVASIGG